MSDTAQNILQRINNIRRAVTYIQKDRSVSTGGGAYRAVSHDAVTALLRAHMIEQGVVCIPSLVTSEFHPPLVTGEGKDAVTAKQRLYEATYDFTFVNADKPSESLLIRMQAHAMDNADKAPGKALSYAKKYALLKLFELETGEDEESRYATPEMDQDIAAQMLSAVSGAATMEELRGEFKTSYKAAEIARDSALMKSLIAAKDARKATLSAANETSA
jgi:hypothetical protein